jgi:hypothetical protein
MRIGVNPEKLKKAKHNYFLHRVIIPVYIPNLEEEYYKDSFEVFKKCIYSLFKTINKNTTVISVIDNNCSSEISKFIQELLEECKIQKLIKYSENKGKVYPILSEIKASYEPYLTISDADVFFMNNWEREVFDIFHNFPKAAVVSPLPCPFLYKYLNRPLLVNEFFNIKLDLNVKPENFQLFEQGVNPKKKFFEGKKWNWKEKQYIIKHKKIKACVGATHFVATIKREYLDFNKLLGTKFVFNNGDENEYLEKFIEENGGYRLSTMDTFAYHMGNTVENWIEDYDHSNTQIMRTKNVDNNLRNKNKFYFLTYRIVFKFLSVFFYKN